VLSSKNSGVIRFAVVSHAVAFAPLSQNSNVWGSAGFAHEQLTHMNPSGLFCFSKIALSFNGTFSCDNVDVTDFNDPQPPDANG
jgi:hypothetical protein